MMLSGLQRLPLIVNEQTKFTRVRKAGLMERRRDGGEEYHSEVVPLSGSERGKARFRRPSEGGGECIG